ncbi:disulfide bond formation protein DsbA [Amycolatopsis regifaucium]|uniref:Disulfide bond formation protein DsbA n=1 Tax=Amycolatopsis regifaucium TaxID=546365 RepID=A0A154MPR7_9PSEU|nr:DsbA family oxidoreductase [Amycolatopsis regifaucium]KZB86308.1 disulfide bond formation protein DsbA [Amycolatopsis regifaucium]OKA05200.1 disulfide bond formation protein DsbA [Amycolatopsis regifaucium]SFH79847.1 Predicted dithiol-disulfide isomerase, DsbA family [Amycolatopsis regifaucium]
MYIDVWSDVVCPWCYLGKRRMETALGEFAHADDVEVRWHSFQLDSSHPKGHREPVRDMLAKKTGAPPEQVEAMTRQVTELAAAEGLTYDLGNAVSVNTLDAHRLNHLADQHGLGDRMHERLLKAHLCDGEIVDDLDTLVRLGTEVGVPEDEAREVLQGTKLAGEVDADFAEARRLGVNGVPFFVLNGAYGVSGAQSPVTFLSALEKAHRSR